MIEIDKGIAMPSRTTRGVLTYPYRDMVVGDSFSVNTDGKQQASVYRMAHVWQKETGFRFAVRKIDASTMRIWRTA